MALTDPDFYSPGEIKYSRAQCIWILQNLDGADTWPPDFKVTGYSGKTKGGLNKRAHFDNVKVIFAEVDRRLKLTKTDGKLLKAQVLGGVTDYDSLEPEAQMALNFISLFDFRKRAKYSFWKRDRTYYYKNVGKRK